MGDKAAAGQEVSERSGASTATAGLGVAGNKKISTFKAVTEQVINVSLRF